MEEKEGGWRSMIACEALERGWAGDWVWMGFGLMLFWEFGWMMEW